MKCSIAQLLPAAVLLGSISLRGVLASSEAHTGKVTPDTRGHWEFIDRPTYHGGGGHWGKPAGQHGNHGDGKGRHHNKQVIQGGGGHWNWNPAGYWGPGPIWSTTSSSSSSENEIYWSGKGGKSSSKGDKGGKGSWGKGSKSSKWGKDSKGAKGGKGAKGWWSSSSSSSGDHGGLGGHWTWVGGWTGPSQWESASGDWEGCGGGFWGPNSISTPWSGSGKSAKHWNGSTSTNIDDPWTDDGWSSDSSSTSSGTSGKGGKSGKSGGSSSSDTTSANGGWNDDSWGADSSSTSSSDSSKSGKSGEGGDSGSSICGKSSGGGCGSSSFSTSTSTDGGWSDDAWGGPDSSTISSDSSKSGKSGGSSKCGKSGGSCEDSSNTSTEGDNDNDDEPAMPWTDDGWGNDGHGVGHHDDAWHGDGHTHSTCKANSPCSEEGARCTKGTESCCGETFDSMVCDCTRNQNDDLEYLCYITDACFVPWCERTSTPTPKPTPKPTLKSTEPKWDGDGWGTATSKPINGWVAPPEMTPNPIGPNWTNDGHDDAWTPPGPVDPTWADDGHENDDSDDDAWTAPAPKPSPPSKSSSTYGKSGKSGETGGGSGSGSSKSSKDATDSRMQISKANSDFKFSESTVNGSRESVTITSIVVHLAAAAVGGAVLLF